MFTQRSTLDSDLGGMTMVSGEFSRHLGRVVCRPGRERYPREDGPVNCAGYMKIHELCYIPAFRHIRRELPSCFTPETLPQTPRRGCYSRCDRYARYISEPLLAHRETNVISYLTVILVPTYRLRSRYQPLMLYHDGPTAVSRNHQCIHD